jgi:hypothetical protein
MENSPELVVSKAMLGSASIHHIRRETVGVSYNAHVVLTSLPKDDPIVSCLGKKGDEALKQNSVLWPSPDYVESCS